MTGFKELTEKDVTIRFDNDPKYIDRAIDIQITNEYDNTPLANCMSVLVRSTFPAEQLIELGEIKEEDGIQKGCFDGVFIDFPKDVEMSIHVIRPDLALFFLERK